MGVHIDIIPFLRILFNKVISVGTRESLSSYVFLKINLYVRAYTWRKKFLSVGIFTQRVSFEYDITRIPPKPS